MTHNFPIHKETTSQVFGPDQVCRHPEAFLPLTKKFNLSLLHSLQASPLQFKAVHKTMRVWPTNYKSTGFLLITVSTAP